MFKTPVIYYMFEINLFNDYWRLQHLSIILQ